MKEKRKSQHKNGNRYTVIKLLKTNYCVCVYIYICEIKRTHCQHTRATMTARKFFSQQTEIKICKWGSRALEFISI